MLANAPALMALLPVATLRAVLPAVVPASLMSLLTTSVPPRKSAREADSTGLPKPTAPAWRAGVAERYSSTFELWAVTWADAAMANAAQTSHLISIVFILIPFTMWQQQADIDHGTRP